jgi:hypothetical protein
MSQPAVEDTCLPAAQRRHAVAVDAAKEHAAKDLALVAELEAWTRWQPQRFKHDLSATQRVRQLGAHWGEMATDALAVLGQRAHAAIECFASSASPVGGVLKEAQQVRAARGWLGVLPGSLIDCAVQRLLPNATLGVTGLAGITQKTLRKCLLPPLPCAHTHLCLPGTVLCLCQTTTTTGASGRSMSQWQARRLWRSCCQEGTSSSCPRRRDGCISSTRCFFTRWWHYARECGYTSRPTQRISSTLALLEPCVLPRRVGT